MNNINWFLRLLFSPHKTEQEKIEWWWYLKIDLPYWFETLPIVQAFQQCVHWTLALVRRNKQSSDDDIPF